MTRHDNRRMLPRWRAWRCPPAPRRCSPAPGRPRRAAACSAAAPARSVRAAACRAERREHRVRRRQGSRRRARAGSPRTSRSTYLCTASDFSWVLPIDAVPEHSRWVSIACSRFAAQITRPSFQVTYVTEETCKADPHARRYLRRQLPPTVSTGAGGTGAGGVNGGVNVVFRGDVGPYDVALHSATSADLLTWLADNKFVVGDAAKSIIEEYVQLNKYSRGQAAEADSRPAPSSRWC